MLKAVLIREKISEILPKVGREPVTSSVADECTSHSATVNRHGTWECVKGKLARPSLTWVCPPPIGHPRKQLLESPLEDGMNESINCKMTLNTL